VAEPVGDELLGRDHAVVVLVHLAERAGSHHTVCSATVLSGRALSPVSRQGAGCRVQAQGLRAQARGLRAQAHVWCGRVPRRRCCGARTRRRARRAGRTPRAPPPHCRRWSYYIAAEDGGCGVSKSSKSSWRLEPRERSRKRDTWGAQRAREGAARSTPPLLPRDHTIPRAHVQVPEHGARHQLPRTSLSLSPSRRRRRALRCGHAAARRRDGARQVPERSQAPSLHDASWAARGLMARGLMKTLARTHLEVIFQLARVLVPLKGARLVLHTTVGS